MAQCFFSSAEKTAKVSTEQKIEILEQIENCSKRETVKVLANLAQDFGVTINKPKDSVKELGSGESSMNLRLKNTTVDKMNRLKALRSHKNPNMTYSELIDDLCNLGLKKYDPLLYKPRVKADLVGARS